MPQSERSRLGRSPPLHSPYPPPAERPPNRREREHLPSQNRSIGHAVRAFQSLRNLLTSRFHGIDGAGVGTIPTEPTAQFPPVGGYRETNSQVSSPGPMTHGPPSSSFLDSAHNFRMGDLRYTTIGVANNVVVDARPEIPRSLGNDGWKILLQQTAPNALHDSKARYDRPKCDKDTRVEVIREMTDWIKDRESSQRLLCMTGAAGSGKSALLQTMAEICSKANILGSAYFFGAADPSRNNTSSLIPTIAYQLGRKNTHLRQYIGVAVEEDELIFSKTLLEQMNALIRDPVRRLHDAETLDLPSFRYVLLIDGLDECQGEDNQVEILTAIKECLLDNDFPLPFRILIASRPEWAIRSALEPNGELNGLAYHIQLSDQYDATGDIRRYLRRRLHQLGLRSCDPRARSSWFTEEDIEQLVIAASGQFIYAATVVRYLSEHRGSLVDRLKIVLTWTPADGQSARPFKPLDLLYSGILSAAKLAYEAVDTHSSRDFLLLFRAYHINATRGFAQIPSNKTSQLSNEELDYYLQLESGAHQAVVSDLWSLVAIRRRRSSSSALHIYHKSFSDFLNEPTRSKELFVPESRVHGHLAKCFMESIIRNPQTGLPACDDAVHSLGAGMRCWTPIYFLLLGLGHSLLDINDALVKFTQQGGWKILTKLIQTDTRSHRSCNSRNFCRNLEFLASIHALRDREPQIAAAMDEVSRSCLGRRDNLLDNLVQNRIY